MSLTISTHVYEVRRRKDKRGVDLISDALRFGRLVQWAECRRECGWVPLSTAAGAHDAAIRVYDDAGNAIETHEHKARFQRGLKVTRRVRIPVTQTHSAFQRFARRRCAIHVREILKYLIKPRAFEDQTHGFLQTSQCEFATVGFNILLRSNKCRQSRAVDVSHAGKIDHQLSWFFRDHCI